MDGYLYLALLLFFSLSALWNYRIGNFRLDKFLPKICVMLFIVFTIHIFYSSVNAIDSINYETRFKYVDTLTISEDFLFSYFIKFIKFFIDDYQIFRGLIGCLYLIPILLIIRRETRDKLNIPLFLLMCLLYPYFQSIVALRFTMASVIVVSALYLYINSNQNKLKTIATIITIIISSLIHDTSIIYLLVFIMFLVYKKVSDKKIITIFLILIDGGIILSLRNGNISGVVNAIIGEANSFYLKIMETAGVGFLISIFLQAAFLYLFFKISSIEKYKCEYAQNVMEQKQVRQDVIILNYCSLIFIPLYTINVITFRLFRGLLILDYLEISKNYKNKNKDALLLGILILEVICMMFDASGIESIISIIGGV